MISLNEYLTNSPVLRLYKVLYILILCICVSNIHGQETTDTTQFDENFVYEKKNSFKSVFYGQPGKAALYSLIAPGGGQLYNKRWWKAPLVWAGEGYFVYNLINSIDNAQGWEQCRIAYLEGSNTDICNIDSNVTISSVTEAFDQQQSAKAAKERAWLFVIAAHLIQTLEAFVDRHLINFNTTDKLTFHSNPTNQIETTRYASAPITVFSVSINLNRIAD